ncbi:39S ribosomal protein L18, mitochondrial [Orchesella cincta]|uniref:Large ribosomal subunit protein uL18m n=1 Tax=Orchesella cincta TaxID=48709 RepID=A0A1D2NH75_ORCCI|nr:39S ribosomal protein L18, mitochondrial [Orchesella cincta]
MSLTKFRSYFSICSHFPKVRNSSIAGLDSSIAASPFAQCRFFSSKNEFPSNDSIIPKFINNRNPKNLEKLRIGEKPKGWCFEKEDKKFWNRVTLDISSRHISASIIHYLGQSPVMASSKEWCIKKYLYSTNDACAAKLVGQVLAQRCLQAGITEVACFFTPDERKKEKVSLFIKAIEDFGVGLMEPPQILPDWNVNHWEIPETPWDIHEDVDDIYSSASKYRGYKIRKHAHPSPKEMNEYNK